MNEKRKEVNSYDEIDEWKIDEKNRNIFEYLILIISRFVKNLQHNKDIEMLK